MRKLLSLSGALLFVCATAWSQAETSKVMIRAILVDDDLNQKPVPRLTVGISAESNIADGSHEVKTDFDGNAEMLLPPGKYELATPQGIDFQNRHYSWGMEINVGSKPALIELSNDNALVTDSRSAQPVRKIDDLRSMFQKYQSCVVTVWSEIGSGTGFIVHPAGLVMTNQHVIGPSELISIQFDAKRKVAAKVLAFDSERDVAVLYADLSAFPNALAAPIDRGQTNREVVTEGEKVFSIGSPLGLKKIITSGIVSKVEERAIFSDITINHGNSGGPLFNALGEVIGITTFLVPGENGPGVSGIVRIDEALPTLGQARKKMADASIPDSRLLPVEPTDPYPLNAIKETLESGKFDPKPYIFTVGDFDVALGTPILKYETREKGSLAAEKERHKRTIKRNGAVQNTFEPLQELRGWVEYAGEYKPVLFVQAAPQLRETFRSSFDRNFAASNGGRMRPARLKFKTDFYRMKLFCGEKEVEPIQPGKASTIENDHNSVVDITDATYVGFYSYPPDAISPSCGRVTLKLYSEKQPDTPESKDLDQKTIDRVWNDFRPYLDAHSKSGDSK